MLSWEYPPSIKGGLGTHMAGLAPALVRAGAEILVITPVDRSEPASARISGDVVASSQGTTEDGVRVYRVPMDSNNNDIYSQARKTNRAILTQCSALLSSGHHFDLIHAHDWLVAFASLGLKHQSHLPLVATIHATERGRFRGNVPNKGLQGDIHAVEGRLAYEAWRVIACSHHMALEVQSFFHVPAGKIDVVPNGVDLHRNGHWTQRDLVNCRSRYGAPDRQVVFGIGRLVHEKGFHVLIEAIPRVLSEFPNTQFVIAGRGPEGPNLMHRADSLDVANHVCFPGFVSDSERDCLFHIASCAVFPSLYEPFGVVALEAMAAGCPVVVSEVGGLREVVSHGQTGITVYPNDPQSVAWGILENLRNPELAASRATEAQQLVERQFNWDSVATRTIAIYQRVLEERGKIDW
jgi:glycosyltransferase involved in cell wall biosynthesis